MSSESPKPLSLAKLRARRNRVRHLARQLGFVGKVEYRHVFSQSGGAQYCRNSSENTDIITVYAEAFERDADPQDFSLVAILAHECGHQVLARHPRISKRVSGISIASEEVLASLLGAMMCYNDRDRQELFAKATFELLARSQPAEVAIRQLEDLWNQLEELM